MSEAMFSKLYVAEFYENGAVKRRAVKLYFSSTLQMLNFQPDYIDYLLKKDEILVEEYGERIPTIVKVH